MPIYEYYCSVCNDKSEIFVSMKDAEEKIPCKCGGTAYRIISGCTFLLKGNPEGWYKPAMKDPKPTPVIGGST